jgi:hypothetical protein
MAFYSRPSDLDRRNRKEEKGRWLTGETNSGEGVQKVDGELAPVVGDGEEVADDVRTTAAMSKA